ncbi:MAG: hypothetical protein J3Q66DRAFT_442421 [Benniella sp.]|nr:MAG: hypothetical protein J3Q66DRAFT_442421 [Benniella sp.]
MGLGFLRALRILLVLLASVIFVTAVHCVRLYGFLGYVATVFLAFCSGIAYGWALKAQAAKMNIIKSNAVRYTCSFLLYAAWLASRGYVFPDYHDNDFGIATDICGLIMAHLVFLELIFAYRYERSSKALKRDAEAMGNIIVGPAPVQPGIPHAHYAPQQYVYGQAQQPGQPLMHYPQPAMTASHQTLTMPNQDPAASYKIPQEMPAHQPHPPPSH